MSEEKNEKTEKTEDHKKRLIDNKWFIIGTFLVLFILVFYFRYQSYEGKISHSFPMTINAGDPNSRLSEAEWVYESKSYDTLPPWFSEQKNIAQHYAPTLIILPAALAQITGLQVYDMFFFVGVLVSLGLAVTFYLLFKKFFNNDTVALIAAFMVYFPYEYFYHYQLNIGMYGNYFTALFYPLATIFLLTYIEDKKLKNLFFLVLVLVFQYYVHASEAIVFIGFIGLYLLIFERKNIKFMHLIGHLAFMGIIFLLMILPHLPLLYYSWVTSGHGTMKMQLFVPINPPQHEPQFGVLNLLVPLLYILFIIGLVFFIKNKKYRVLVSMFVFFFTITFILGLIGIGTYYVTVRTRYLLFMFMYPIAALGIGLIINSLEKWKAIRERIGKDALTILIILIIITTTFFTAKAYTSSGSLINKDMYDGFLWIRQNTPEESRVMCFGCFQFEGLNTHRRIFQPNYFVSETVQQLVDLGDQKSNNTLMSVEYSGYRDTAPVKKNFFVYETQKMQGFEEKNFCDSDYFIIKGYGQLTQAFIKINQRLMTQNATVVFYNQNIIILKNNHVGGVCI